MLSPACRQSLRAHHSQIRDVQQLLARHDARATFFVCSKYLQGVEVEASSLVADGHELGNHLVEDLAFVYSKKPKEAISTDLKATTEAIEALPGRPPVAWFRAPQGILSQPMADALAEQGLRHALGDAYCDDWALPRDVPFAARTILSQATAGSVIILHMPERGYREHTFALLERILAGLAEKGLTCVTLSEAAQMESAAKIAGAPLTVREARSGSAARSSSQEGGDQPWLFNMLPRII